MDKEKKDLIELMVKKDRLDEFVDRLTIKDMIDYVQENFKSEHPHKMDCPVCNRKIGLEKKAINDVTLHFLSTLFMMTKAQVKDLNSVVTYPSFYYPTVFEKITKILGEEDKPENLRTKPTGFTRLAMWGFIEPDKDKTRGSWRITKLGIKFLYNQYKAPKKAYIVAGEVIDWSDELITFNECDVLDYEQRQQYRTTKYF